MNNLTLTLCLAYYRGAPLGGMIHEDYTARNAAKLRANRPDPPPQGSTPNFAEKRAQILDKELWLFETAEVAAAWHFCVLHQVEVALEKTLGSCQG